MKRDYYLFTLPALVVVLLDQISKLMVTNTITYHESIPVINGFFNLVHVRNRGMAFGLMNRPDAGVVFYILVAATIMAILLLIYWFTRLKNEDRMLILGLSLILGGAVGNLIDRIRLMEVIDFLDFYIGAYHWPAFNLADSAITVGTFWVAINILFISSSDSRIDN
ncbi:signal peptidase II [Thermodesulfobacteriota bacterium]